MILTTSTPLTGNASYTTPELQVEANQRRITATVIADQSGTIYIEQSTDGSNWDISTSRAIPASDGKGITEDIVTDYWRIRYVNGSVAQNLFRLFAKARL